MAWGNNTYGQTNIPAAATNVMAIAAGGNNSLILRSNGTVLEWGDGYMGTTNVPSNVTNAVAVAVGDHQSMALRKNGTVVVWGGNFTSATNVPAAATNIMAIVSGAFHCLALRSNGTLVAWGNNSYGQTNISASLTNVIAISAGGNHNFVLKSDGSAFCWGDASGNFSSGNNGIVAVGTGDSSGGNYLLTLRGNGATPGAFTATTSNAVAIATGNQHNLVLLGDGSPYLYGPPKSWPASLPGDNISTRVNVSGWGRIYYQWQLNGTNILDATNAVLSLTNIPITLAGVYRCIISNALGTVISPETTLNIQRLPLQFGTAAQDTQMTPSGFKLRVTGLAGQGPLIVYASTNLTDWFPILTNPPSVGSFDILDTNAVDLPSLYYRVSEGP
jgi:hypothetical protein